MANPHRRPTEAERRREARQTLVQRIADYVERVRIHRKGWAPAGGGTREVARRMQQVEAGTLQTTHAQAASKLFSAASLLPYQRHLARRAGAGRVSFRGRV